MLSDAESHELEDTSLRYNDVDGKSVLTIDEVNNLFIVVMEQSVNKQIVKELLQW